MSWKQKVELKELKEFCMEWRSRNEVQIKFKLSNVESWHCINWCTKLPDFESKTGVGITKKASMIKTRHSYL